MRLIEQERTIFDNRTRMSADNQDFKKHKGFDNLRK